MPPVSVAAPLAPCPRSPRLRRKARIRGTGVFSCAWRWVRKEAWAQCAPVAHSLAGSGGKRGIPSQRGRYGCAVAMPPNAKCGARMYKRPSGTLLRRGTSRAVRRYFPEATVRTNNWISALSTGTALGARLRKWFTISRPASPHRGPSPGQRCGFRFSWADMSAMRTVFGCTFARDLPTSRRAASCPA